MSETKNNNWRFCVVGNIIENHSDNNGNTYYGTKAFVGGTKVYIYEKYWDKTQDEVPVIGLNRFKKYVIQDTPLYLIKNIRLQKIYKPTILEIMDYVERFDGMNWRTRTSADRKEAINFIENWKKIYQ